MAVEQYANNATTTLNGSINNSTTSVVVADASSFPSSGQFRILIDSEVMLVTSVTGNTFTVATRGTIDGTSAATHNDASTVSHVLTKDSLLKLTADGVSRGTYANLPAAGRAGRVYTATDNPFTYYDDGSAWNARAFGSAMDLNPNLSDFATWVNQDSATIDTSKGWQKLTTLTGQPNSTERNHVRVKAVGGLTTWDMTLVFSYIDPPGAGSLCGIYLRESASGKLMVYSPGIVSNQARLRADTYSSPTAYNLNIFSDTVYWWGQPIYLRLSSDATTFYFKYSANGGLTWLTHTTLTIAGSYLSGYDQVGFGIDNAVGNNALQQFEMDVYHAVFG